MQVTIARPDEIAELSKLSQRVGNIPFFPGHCTASILREAGEIIGFCAVQEATHAAGSWVREDFRKLGLTYEMRKKLEEFLRNEKGVPMYFAIPGSDFEKMLFAKYGAVEERTVQVKRL